MVNRNGDPDNWFNGWANHATMCVAFHLSSQDRINNEVVEICKKHEFDALPELKEYVHENIELESNLSHNAWGKMASDLMFGYLQEVDFLEIVQHYREENK